MRWPWKRLAEAKAHIDEAEVETEVAKKQFERTIADAVRIASALSTLFAHAERNEFSEKIQKVARGH